MQRGGPDFIMEAKAEVRGISLELRHYPNVPAGRNFWIETNNSIGLITYASHKRLRARYQSGGQGAKFFDVGTAYFRPRHLAWEASSDGGETRGVLCVFDDVLLEQTFGLGSVWTNEELNHCFNLRYTSITQILRILEQEARTPGFATSFLIEAGATMLVALLARYLKAGANLSRADRGRLSSAQLGRIDEYLMTLKGRSPGLTELAQVCGLSTRSLQRKIKLTTGVSATSYVTQAQLAHAKSLLAANQVPLKEIAHSLGFSNYSNFSQAFLKVVGITPSAYRNQLS